MQRDILRPSPSKAESLPISALTEPNRQKSRRKKWLWAQKSQLPHPRHGGQKAAKWENRPTTPILTHFCHFSNFSAILPPFLCWGGIHFPTIFPHFAGGPTLSVPTHRDHNPCQLIVTYKVPLLDGHSSTLQFIISNLPKQAISRTGHSSPDQFKTPVQVHNLTSSKSHWEREWFHNELPNNYRCVTGVTYWLTDWLTSRYWCLSI